MCFSVLPSSTLSKTAVGCGVRPWTRVSFTDLNMQGGDPHAKGKGGVCWLWLVSVSTVGVLKQCREAANVSHKLLCLLSCESELDLLFCLFIMFIISETKNNERGGFHAVNKEFCIYNHGIKEQLITLTSICTVILM